MSKLKPGMRARYIIFVVAVFGMFAYLTYGLVQLQLVQTEEYSETAESRRTKTIALRGKRGMITDADSVILANDEYIYNVTFYKDASSLTRAQYAVFSQSIVDTIEIIERNGGELSVEFVIARTRKPMNGCLTLGPASAKACWPPARSSGAPTIT